MTDTEAGIMALAFVAVSFSFFVWGYLMGRRHEHDKWYADVRKAVQREFNRTFTERNHQEPSTPTYV